MGNVAVDTFLEAIQTGTMNECDVFTETADMDATVPNWRFSVRGAHAIRAELGRWFADVGCFEDLIRTPLPEGELVEFTLCWEEATIPHAVHQAHVLRTEGDRIASDHAWCGGRWPAALLAEMAEAAHAGV